jgi:hypothetical protein
MELSRWTVSAIILGCLLAGCTGEAPQSGSSTDSATSPAAPPAGSFTLSSASTYLGEQPPGEEPKLYAPGIVNTEAIELNGVVSPDGGEFFFTRVIDGVFVMHRRLLGEDGGWSDPEPVYTYPDRAPGLAVDMAYSPDGSRLYFLGAWSEERGADETNEELFVIERQGDGWSLASALPAPVNTPDFQEWYPSVVSDGSLYFASDRAGGQGESDIWRAQRLDDGTFAEPVNLGPPVNSEHREGDTWVAPDESWLVVTSRRPGGPGNGDLFVSFRDESGAWSEPRPLPPPINTELLDYCPMGTPDGRYLFFSRRTGASWDEADAGDVYWIDIAALERLRPPPSGAVEGSSQPPDREEE